MWKRCAATCATTPRGDGTGGGGILANARWTRQQLLVAFWLYCRLPFGRLHHRNPQIANTAKAIDRTPSALAMKLVNIASLDPTVTSTGRRGLRGASTKDREMWAEMQQDWEAFAVEAKRAVQAAEIGQTLSAAPTAGSHANLGGERLATARVRIGQTFFRDALLSAYGGRCCVTGLATPELLIASHIVPWCVDRSNRANPRKRIAVVSAPRQSVRQRLDYRCRGHDGASVQTPEHAQGIPRRRHRPLPRSAHNAA